MDYQEIVNTTGLYSIEEHLLAFKAGFKCSRLSDSLKDNVLELKWNRNSDAQRLVYRLLKLIDDNDTINDVDKIEELLIEVRADRIINQTPQTFQEYWDGEKND